MNNTNNDLKINKFNSTVGFNEMKIGRIFQLESFANDFNNKLKKKYDNLIDSVIILYKNIF
jgi:hypothetical protein